MRVAEEAEAVARWRALEEELQGKAHTYDEHGDVILLVLDEHPSTQRAGYALPDDRDAQHPGSRQRSRGGPNAARRALYYHLPTRGVMCHLSICKRASSMCVSFPWKRTPRTQARRETRRREPEG